MTAHEPAHIAENVCPNDGVNWTCEHVQAAETSAPEDWHRDLAENPYWADKPTAVASMKAVLAQLADLKAEVLRLADLIECLKGMLTDEAQDNGGWKDSLRYLITEFGGAGGGLDEARP